MNLRVTITGEVKPHEWRNRSESEPEEGVESVGVDAKPRDLHSFPTRRSSDLLIGGEALASYRSLYLSR